MPTPPQAVPETLQGKTVRWQFSEGPTQGTVYEHVIGKDGSISWNSAGGKGKGESPVDGKGTVEKVADNVHVISYLSPSGFALTAVLNFEDGSVLSFASNEKEWFPAHGTFEIVG